jgi:hypothetical protein
MKRNLMILVHSPRKSLAKLAREADVLVSSARTTTKLLKLHPYKIKSACIATKRPNCKDTFLQVVYPVSE